MVVCAGTIPRSSVMATRSRYSTCNSNTSGRTTPQSPSQMPTLEQLFDRYEPWHLSIIADSVPVCTRARGLLLVEIAETRLAFILECQVFISKYEVRQIPNQPAAQGI